VTNTVPTPLLPPPNEVLNNPFPAAANSPCGLAALGALENEWDATKFEPSALM
jgi:hypothetical protein